MADNETNSTDLTRADILWKAADALRGQVDAAEYKHVVLGLLFLKYISDCLRVPPRRTQGRAGEATASAATQLETPARKPRRVHRRARLLGAARSALAEPSEPGHAARHRHADRRRHPRRRARQPEPQGQAPARLRPPRHRAGEDEGADRPDRRHRLQGRPRQGPRHARPRLRILPRQVRRRPKASSAASSTRRAASSALLVEMLEPYEGRVYDPCCGSGGMFVQSEKFVEAHGGQKTDISIFGQESNPTTWRLAHMNLAIRGIEANLGAAARRHASCATCTPTSRPTTSSPIRRSTSSDWSGKLLRGRRALALRRRRPSATPTTPGSSTSSTTSPRPTAAAAAWPASSWPTARSPPTPAARATSASSIVEADLVDCHRRPARAALLHHRHPRLPLVPHPRQDRQEPRSTADAPTAARAKRSSSTPASSARCRPARCACSPAATTARCCRRHGRPAPDSDIGRIVYAFRQWRGEPAPDWWDEAQHGAWAYRDIPGFCKAATIEEIAKHGFVLTPGRYVGAEEQEDDAEPFAEKYPRLLAELEEQLGGGGAVDGGGAGTAGEASSMDADDAKTLLDFA